MSNVELISVKVEVKETLANLLELYLYELSKFENLNIDERGKFGYEYLDLYWKEKERFPFFIKVDGKLAGFVLINEHSYISPDVKTIAEFFVLQGYRKQGIGTRVAFKVFDMFPSRWEVAENAQNTSAQDFWRKVINEYTNGHYIERTLNNETWKGPIQQFDAHDPSASAAGLERC
jgi:predicted acetyltransferase